MCATRLSLLSSLPSSVVSLTCPTIDTRSYTADPYSEEYSLNALVPISEEKSQKFHMYWEQKVWAKEDRAPPTTLKVEGQNVNILIK